jgi:DNA segregation ATPase FtsK/SpoIIIE, S-DNA-T family
LWVLGALALLLLLALLTYPRARSRVSGHRRAGTRSATGSGRSGAWLAGFFFFCSGARRILFPLMLAYAGWLVHKEQALPDARSRINTLLRAAGFVLTLLTSCGLATLHWDGSGLPNSAGGVLGELVGKAARAA